MKTLTVKDRAGWLGVKLSGFSLTCHWQHNNATLYATRDSFKLTGTEILLTEEKLVCADS